MFYSFSALISMREIDASEVSTSSLLYYKTQNYFMLLS